MQMFVELMMNMISLVMKPFLLVKVVCLLGARTVILAFIAWLQLVKTIIIYQINLCWRIISWIVAVLVLPFRILNALQSEKTLEMIIHEMQHQLDNLIWENQELEEQLQIAIKDRRIIEIVFEEIEEEHDKALARIDLLENQLQDLKDENMRLNELHGTSLWTHKIQEKGDVIPPVSKLGVQSWSSSYNGSRVILEDIVMGRDTWSNGNKDKPQDQDALKSGHTAVDSYSFPPQITSRSLLVDEVRHQQRCIAISRSLFSATLSLLVGMIIWEAEDPCMPLVAALFTVVGISLYSVVQLFSAINSKPASDAVALLSFNWFILGTLTYPTLPRVAPVLAPPVIWLADQVLSWLNFSA